MGCKQQIFENENFYSLDILKKQHKSNINGRLFVRKHYATLWSEINTYLSI